MSRDQKCKIFFDAPCPWKDDACFRPRYDRCFEASPSPDSRTFPTPRWTSPDRQVLDKPQGDSLQGFRKWRSTYIERGKVAPRPNLDLLHECRGDDLWPIWLATSYILDIHPVRWWFTLLKWQVQMTSIQDDLGKGRVQTWTPDWPINTAHCRGQEFNNRLMKRTTVVTMIGR